MKVPSLGAVLGLVAGCVCTDSIFTATFPLPLCDGGKEGVSVT